jgi:hypothetical protein
VALKPAGQDSEMPIAARNGHSTAPLAPECQSFLDNLLARFRAKGSANDPTVGDRYRRRELADRQELSSPGRSIFFGGDAGPPIAFTD